MLLCSACTICIQFTDVFNYSIFCLASSCKDSLCPICQLISQFIGSCIKIGFDHLIGCKRNRLVCWQTCDSHISTVVIFPTAQGNCLHTCPQPQGHYQGQDDCHYLFPHLSHIKFLLFLLYRYTAVSIIPVPKSISHQMPRPPVLGSE